MLLSRLLLKGVLRLLKPRFNDKSSIWIRYHSRIYFRIEEMAAKLRPEVKYLYKMHIWASTSKQGTTQIILFTDNMKSEFYVESILLDTLLPFVT